MLRDFQTKRPEVAAHCGQIFECPVSHPISSVHAFCLMDGASNWAQIGVLIFVKNNSLSGNCTMSNLRWNFCEFTIVDLLQTKTTLFY